MQFQRRKDILRWPLFLLKSSFQHPTESNVFIQYLAYATVLSLQIYHLYYVLELLLQSKNSRDIFAAFESITTYMHVKY